MTTRNPRQTRFRQELKRLLKRGMPPATAMKKAWARVPKNPQRRNASDTDRRCKKCGVHTIYKSGICRWCQEAEKRKNPRLTARKARTILHHGRIKGRALTPRQRGLFGAVASGYRLREYTNPPPIKVLANGRLVGLIGFRPTRGRKVGRNPSIDIRV